MRNLAVLYIFFNKKNNVTCKNKMKFSVNRNDKKNIYMKNFQQMYTA